MIVAQHTGPEPVGLTSLGALSDAVGAQICRPGPEIAPSTVRLESGTGVDSVYALRMHLPLVDPASLSLGRADDDLIVGADGHRRRVRLASVLRRCTVDSAELDGTHLVVRFRPDPRCVAGMTDAHGDLVEELRLLMETVLERAEPALRRAASGMDQPEFAGCTWCPVCAVAALVRGEHHELATKIAEHGTAIVTVLREALAGVPVDAGASGATPAARATPTARAPARQYVPIPVNVR